MVYSFDGEKTPKIGYNIDMTKISIALLVAGLLFVSGAKAQEMHPVLKKFQDEKHAKIEFLGHDHGLDGWLITGKNDAGADIAQYAYTTSEGGIVLGVMFGPDGEVTTIKQLEAYSERMKTGGQGALPMEKLVRGMEPPKSLVPKAEDGSELEAGKVPKAEKFYALTEKTSWVQIGKKEAPYMYVYINPTCDHCVTYWKTLRKYVDEGTLSLRLVPFGAVAQNRTLGAALLASKDGEKAWREFAEGNAGALSATDATDEMLNKIDRNTALFGQFQLKSGPPFSIYRAPVDGKIKAVLGKPDNVMMLMTDFMN